MTAEQSLIWLRKKRKKKIILWKKTSSLTRFFFCHLASPKDSRYRSSLYNGKRLLFYINFAVFVRQHIRFFLKAAILIQLRSPANNVFKKFTGNTSQRNWSVVFSQNSFVFLKNWCNVSQRPRYI